MIDPSSGGGCSAGSVQCPRQMERMEQRARPQVRELVRRRTLLLSSSGVLMSGDWKPELLLAIALRVVSISLPCNQPCWQVHVTISSGGTLRSSLLRRLHRPSVALFVHTWHLCIF